MLRLTFVCLCCLALGAGTTSFGDHWKLPPLLSHPGSSDPVTVPTKWQTRQRFLLDLLLQVHKPLLHQELVEMGSLLNDNPREYKEVRMRKKNLTIF